MTQLADTIGAIVIIICCFDQEHALPLIAFVEDHLVHSSPCIGVGRFLLQDDLDAAGYPLRF